MSEFIHGGDVISYKNYYDGEMIDFSSNINPLGLPNSVKTGIELGMRELDSYPDVKYRRLKSNLSKYLGANQSQIVVGNGAVEVIDLVISIFKRIILVYPAFAEYELRSEVHGLEIVKIPLNDDFSLDLESISDEMEEGTLILIGNPNNPTGNRIEINELSKLHDIAVENKGFLLLDEAFFEFCPYDYDTVELYKLTGYKHIGIIRAATKFFSLPGIRLGYGVFSEEMVKKLELVQLPWSINAFADGVSEFIFSDTDFIENSKDYIAKEREYLLRELRKIEELTVFDTVVNYVLIKLNGFTDQEIFEKMASKGILVRRCSNYLGLDDSFIRVAIKSRPDNEKLIAAFKESFSEM